jgi:hypothetical protein
MPKKSASVILQRGRKYIALQQRLGSPIPAR